MRLGGTQDDYGTEGGVYTPFYAYTGRGVQRVFSHIRISRMGIVREVYNPYPVGVNGTFNFTGVFLGGFLCTVAGTLNLTQGGVAKVTNLPVTDGTYVPIPIGGPCTIVLSAGAAGTVMGA